jgi:arylsulfatase A-like enzyme
VNIPTLVRHIAVLLLLSVSRHLGAADDSSESFRKYGQEFQGRIGRSYEESQEWWPSTPKPPAGTPNVLIILLDDVGFAHLGSYGGLIATPNLDKLAAGGLRYTNFHTTALCSPSRAALMAGRNPHRIGLGSHSLTAMGFPGYNGFPPESAKSVAKDFQKAGFVTYALGKWDHTPLYEVSPSGPFDRWPGGEGFSHFYGFMAADADNYRTLLYNDQWPTEDWVGKPGYHLTTALADRAIENITANVSASPDRPFLMFWAPSAMHSPHQVEKKYRDMYRGKFDAGWDNAREVIHERQLDMGIIPKGTQLSPRAEAIPAWDSLTAEQKKMYAREMEVFAGMMTQTDEQIGRIIAALERTGQLDNTLILVTSDNGSSGEGGLEGTHNEMILANGMQTTLAENMKHYDDWGGPNTYGHFHAGWAMAGNTPFKYFKQTVHNGGIADPLIVSWPRGFRGKGEIRNQYAFITDLAPTILEVTRTPFLDEVDGHRQIPLDGKSLVYSFDDAAAPSQRTEQLYEQFGNRAMYKDGWKAVSLHGNRMPWIVAGTFPFDKDTWELYHVDEDFSESVNVADKNPEKLAELTKRWDELAEAGNVYPLYDDIMMRIAKQQDRLFGDRKVFTYYAPGAVRLAEKTSAPVKDRSHTIETTLDLTGKESGVIVACGGLTGGYTLYIKDGKLHYDYNAYNINRYSLTSPSLPKGKVDVKFTFTKTGLGQGVGALSVNGAKVAETTMPKMHLSTFSLSETFDVGVDLGTPVSQSYGSKDPHFPYTGVLDKVTITLTGDDTDRAKEVDGTAELD